MDSPAMSEWVGTLFDIRSNYFVRVEIDPAETKNSGAPDKQVTIGRRLRSTINSRLKYRCVGSTNEIDMYPVVGFGKGYFISFEALVLEDFKKILNIHKGPKRATRRCSRGKRKNDPMKDTYWQSFVPIRSSALRLSITELETGKKMTFMYEFDSYNSYKLIPTIVSCPKGELEKLKGLYKTMQDAGTGIK